MFGYEITKQRGFIGKRKLVDPASKKQKTKNKKKNKSIRKVEK